MNATNTVGCSVSTNPEELGRALRQLCFAFPAFPDVCTRCHSNHATHAAGEKSFVTATTEQTIIDVMVAIVQGGRVEAGLAWILARSDGLKNMRRATCRNFIDPWCNGLTY